MRQHFRLRTVRAARIAGYLLLAALLLGGLLSGPQAWATPVQAGQQQTVPTRTPKPAEPTAPPTSAPPPTAEPRPTEAPPPTTAPAPTALPATPTALPAAPTALPAAPSPSLRVALIASPLQVWSGVTVVYTLTVENRATTAARGVVLAAQLPTELQPGAIFAPAGARWNGATMQATLAELAAGAQAQAVFSAQVAPRVAAGKIIVVRASATAAGGAPVEASAPIAMPPAELPAVGRDADRGR